ncbi:unnamed protein product [Pleuronectes platessa]|uniref:Uncharacterized protein n=1 Tax=Pleuronectes platessa TaxID=8262 RepID=A0A9N7TT29_PLEPL|nr:unnamed protein product [Pleuronectes platessa]
MAQPTARHEGDPGGEEQTAVSQTPCQAAASAQPRSMPTHLAHGAFAGHWKTPKADGEVHVSAGRSPQPQNLAAVPWQRHAVAGWHAGSAAGGFRPTHHHTHKFLVSTGRRWSRECPLLTAVPRFLMEGVASREAARSLQSHHSTMREHRAGVIVSLFLSVTRLSLFPTALRDVIRDREPCTSRCQRNPIYQVMCQLLPLFEE